MHIPLHLSELAGRRLRLFTRDNAIYDCVIEVVRQPKSRDDRCCVKVIVNGMAQYLSAEALRFLRATDETCLGTDLILIFDR